jgi:two-component system, OmpR family, aerobic respiration control sensor histidine kinase ArcB
MDILLVEDNEIQAWIMKAQLRQLGHTVFHAKTGHEAIKMYQRGYDLVFLDLGLPDMPGCQVAMRLRAQSNSEINIIAVTADDSEARRKAIQAGCNSAYKKPLAIEDLKWLCDNFGKLGANNDKKVNNERGRYTTRSVRATYYNEAQTGSFS